MTESRNPLQFPCEFPIKVMGRSSEEFEAEILDVFRKHIDVEAAAVSTRPSGAGNFLSVTVQFTADSQQQLDALYRELSEHDKVLFCL